MENLLSQLKRFYMLLSAPALAVFALCYFAADEPLVLEQTRYYILIVIYILALVSVPVSSFIMRRAVDKCAGLSEQDQVATYNRAYRIRLITLNVISYLCGPLYVVTLEQGCCYLFAIVTIVILLSYPTRSFVFTAQNRDND
ncbi:MAG: hypothetical protein IKR17_00055 [Bacteroidales bacterium]|nr:hypothetical protein [Bacteroidales bacterium]